MNTPNEPKPLGAEDDPSIFNCLHELADTVCRNYILIEGAEDDGLMYHVRREVAEITEHIRTLTAENATLLKQRDMMSHLLNGGTFTPEEIVAAGLGMCTLEDRAHAVYRLKQENAELVKALEIYAKEENWTNTVGGGSGEDDYEIEMYRAMKWQRDEEDGWELAKAALAQAGGPLCVNCGVGFILPSGVCDHCDTKQAGGKEGV